MCRHGDYDQVRVLATCQTQEVVLAKLGRDALFGLSGSRKGFVSILLRRSRISKKCTAFTLRSSELCRLGGSRVDFLQLLQRMCK